MKLSTVSRFKIQLALRLASESLHELKARHLTGKELAEMKQLESAVQTLEAFAFEA